MTAPDAPFPKTAAASPVAFKEAFEAAFAAGAPSVVCLTVAASLSGTFKSATLGREMLPEREIHVVDTDTAAFGQALLAILARDLAPAGRSGAEIAAEVRPPGAGRRGDRLPRHARIPPPRRPDQRRPGGDRARS